jgi:hypothetical protein
MPFALFKPQLRLRPRAFIVSLSSHHKRVGEWDLAFAEREEGPDVDKLRQRAEGDAASFSPQIFGSLITAHCLVTSAASLSDPTYRAANR